jgi:rhombotail lipoprotein
MKLLDAVAKQFQAHPFITEIEIIPTAYLKAGGGFDNLRQLRTMLDIDVIALVAYDQIQHTDEDWLSLSYLTVVGAFVINGEKNDTSTMLDTTVFHIPSRKLLFRAPGTSHVKARATLVNHSEQLRKDAQQGMQEANTQMIANLDRELTRFKKRVKERPEQYKVTRAAGYSGGGNLGFAGGLAACLLLLVAWRRNESISQ